MFRRSRLAILGTVALVLFASLQMGAAASGTPPQRATVSPDPSLGVLVLTSDPGDHYRVGVAGSSTRTAADAGNRNGNTRIAFWRQSDPQLPDAESCGTWRSATRNVDQEGAALRVSVSGGAGRAITVTKNIFGTNYLFNVHLWDTTAAPYPFRLIGQFDLSRTFAPHGSLRPLPWSLCAQAIGNRVSFIAWPAGDPQPAWNDADHGGSVLLPSGWDYAGNAGWYVGHLRASDAVVYDGLSAGLPTVAPTVAAVGSAGGINNAP